MGLDRTIHTLSNINMLMSSGLNYMNDKKNGDNTGAAEINLGQNLINGAVRNEIAYDMRKTYGTNLGFLVNNLAGYGTPEANEKGTTGLMGASLFTGMMNPMGFGCYPSYGMMGMAPMGGMNPFGFGGGFGGGMCGPSVFGGGCFGGHHHHVHSHGFRGRGNVFVQNNYYC